MQQRKRHAGLAQKRFLRAGPPRVIDQTRAGLFERRGCGREFRGSEFAGCAEAGNRRTRGLIFGNCAADRLDAAAFLATAAAVLSTNAVAAVAIGCSFYMIQHVAQKLIQFDQSGREKRILDDL